jgi:hypothetical protein
VETVVLGDLTAQFERDAAALRIRLTGRSASREAGDVLAPLFDRALAEGKAEGRSLVLHFERLDYFNSSTIAALVQFIRAAQQASVGLNIVYDAAQRWQAMSFDALRRALRTFDGTRGGAAVTFTNA